MNCRLSMDIPSKPGELGFDQETFSDLRKHFLNSS